MRVPGETSCRDGRASRRRGGCRRGTRRTLRGVCGASRGLRQLRVLGNLFSSHLDVSPSLIAGCFYAAEGIDAAMHAMHVACGSDSFARGRDVPAPRFICESVCDSGMPAEAIERLFFEAGEAAFSFGLRRDEDARSRAAADMAVELARFVFDDLGKCSVMVQSSSPQASVFSGGVFRCRGIGLRRPRRRRADGVHGEGRRIAPLARAGVRRRRCEEASTCAPGTLERGVRPCGRTRRTRPRGH